MKFPSNFLLPALLAVFVFTNCSSDSSSGGDGSVKGDGSATADVPVSTGNKSVDEILAEGVKSLKADKWDEAIAYYNAAYAKDNNNEKAIIYSVLANLAKISTDANVVALIKNNFGFTTYPNRLNALFSTDWMKKTPDNYPIYEYYDSKSGNWAYWREAEYDDVSKDGYYRYDYNSGNYVLVSATPKYDSTWMPVIKTPAWVQGTGSAYNDALLSGNIMTADAWAISLIANIVDRNSNGLNQTLDEVISAVFGASYNEAVTRLKKLENRKSETINLDPYFIQQLNLEDVFDGYDEIGWAELNAVVSAMLAMKASLEWVSSYDLNTDLNWLKFAWKDEADFINKFKAVDKSRLPFNNGFLKARSDGASRMNKAKDTYKTAIKGWQASYTVIKDSKIYPSEVKDAYNTINGGFNALISAIDANSKFYIPEDPTKGTWPTSNNSSVVGSVDLGKFFAPGYFSLDKIFETESGKPVFYACYWYYGYDGHDWIDELRGEKLNKDNYSEILSEEDEWGDGMELCLKANTSYLKSIVDEENINEIAEEFIDTDLRGDLAKAVFEKYHK